MKHKIPYMLAAGLLILSMLLCGCQHTKEDQKEFEDLVKTMDVALQEGHFFFTGKVLSVGNNSEPITFYDQQATTNTIYQVEVTEDYFGYMPQEPITVCIFGTENNFSGRRLLEKDKTYLFDTTPWVYGDQVIYLLPSFYLGMPEVSGEDLFYAEYDVRDAVSRSYSYYKTYLNEKATEQSYDPALVLSKLCATLQEVTRRNGEYFAQKGFEGLAEEHLNTTITTAQGLLLRAKEATASWEAIREVLAS